MGFNFSEYIQWGFAGFAFVLLGIIVWMVKQLIAVITKNNKVLARVFDAINSLKGSEEMTKDSVEIMRSDSKESMEKLEGKVDDLREKVLARPCLKRSTSHECQ